jgi:hypothetical protein
VNSDDEEPDTEISIKREDDNFEPGVQGALEPADPVPVRQNPRRGARDRAPVYAKAKSGESTEAEEGDLDEGQDHDEDFDPSFDNDEKENRKEDEDDDKENQKPNEAENENDWIKVEHEDEVMADDGIIVAGPYSPAHSQSTASTMVSPGSSTDHLVRQQLESGPTSPANSLVELPESPSIRVAHGSIDGQEPDTTSVFGPFRKEKGGKGKGKEKLVE